MGVRAPAVATEEVVHLLLHRMVTAMDIEGVIPLRIRVVAEHRFTTPEHIPTRVIALQVGQVLRAWDQARKAPLLTIPTADQVVQA